jgi:glycosyltransferase involved in cell wall biosynthesis
MLFSIIIPVYNVEKYLNECVDSLLSQDFKEFELILVDDGSQDRGGLICDEYAQKDARVKVVHQENAGLAVARNTGTDIAQGEYIVYVDSDDYICDSAFLSKLAKKTKDKADVILYGYKKFFESSQTFGNDICAYPALKGKSAESVIALLLQTDMYDGSAWNKTIRREFLNQNQIRFVPGMISEDSDWFLQVGTRAKSYDNVNEAFLVYRQREGSISHAPKIKSLTDNLHILESWTKRFDECFLSEEMKKSLTSILARHYTNMLVLYARFSKKK